MKRIFAIFFACVVLAGCQWFEPRLSELVECPDERFVGVWVYTDSGTFVPMAGAFDYSKQRYAFFDTNNKYYYQEEYTQYGNDVAEYPIKLYYEWKIEDNQFAQRIWRDPESEWEYFDFAFPDENTMILADYSYNKN